MNEPYRLRYTNQIVGAFLLILILFLIVLALLLLRASSYFAERKNFWFEISQEQVDDLHPGTEVMILGQRAGQIETIRYVENSDRVRINLAIDSDKSEQITTDSIIVPDRKYGVGTPILNIRRGGSEAGSRKPLAPGNPIATFRGEDDRIERMAREVESVSESVRRIQEKLDPTISTIDAAAVALRTSIGETINPSFEKTTEASQAFLESNQQLRPEASETLRVVREATRSLETQIGLLNGKIQRLVEQDMQSTLAEVRQSTNDISAAAKTANETSTEVGQGISQTLVKLQQAAEQVSRLAEESREVVRIVRGEANDLPGTTARVNDAVSETQDLVDEISSHWLLRRSSSRSSSTNQVSPSSVRGGYPR